METFQSRLTRKLSEALSSAGFPLAGEVSPATDPRFGDYQSNAALVLGKQRGENPRKIAETIIANLAVTEISEQPSVAGAGFINFILKREAVETKIAALLGDERLGVEKVSSPRKIVIDFGSPNVAKPMHVGHIRSIFWGDALPRKKVLRMFPTCIGLATFGDPKSITIFRGEETFSTPSRSSPRSAAIFVSTASGLSMKLMKPAPATLGCSEISVTARLAIIVSAILRGFSPRCFPSTSAALL